MFDWFTKEIPLNKLTFFLSKKIQLLQDVPIMDATLLEEKKAQEELHYMPYMEDVHWK